MLLYLEGHDYRYASEQILLVLFPEDRPETPAPGIPFPPPGEKSAARIRLRRREEGVTAVSEICRGGRTARGEARVRWAPEAPALERDSLSQRALKRSFYRAALNLGLQPPPWGALTGVRPGKLMEPLLLEGMSLRKAAREMEKRYFVTPERASLCADAAAEGIRVRNMLGPRDAILYIGIPFCPTRCAYCSFVSLSVEKSLKQIGPFVEALLREIAAAGDAARRAGLRIRALYMGGGTPTTLSADELRKVLTAAREAFDFSGLEELTVEAGRPDTVTEERLKALRDCGVTRLSINPQTMSDEVLRAIGRRHTAGEVIKAYELARKAGDWAINMDLIAGLPLDTPEGFMRSLDTVTELGAEDVTVHTLALKKGSRITLEGTPLPGGEEVARMLDYAAPTLRHRGYAPYYLYRQKFSSGGFENVGWRKEKGGSFYNVAMMEELCHVIALGGAASTKLLVPGGRIERRFNPKYPAEYLRDIEGILQKKEDIVTICGPAPRDA